MEQGFSNFLSHVYISSPHFPSAGPGVIARPLVVLRDDTLCSAGVLLEVSWLWDCSLELQMDGALVLGDGQKKRSVALLSAEIQHLYSNTFTHSHT